ncbi:hypothetical protein GSUB_09120 [Geoalkalibacter subterraneus]|uniref:Uncharacterized protein n=1 Tax=Geoalkalibacter subterraneus TaxID=483547 RepID=A0A0B5FH22_9BACT|nr:hypothetical protein GSUB_09120 [Geoalkalibacter subterraneus]
MVVTVAEDSPTSSACRLLGPGPGADYAIEIESVDHLVEKFTDTEIGGRLLEGAQFPPFRAREIIGAPASE